MRRYCMECEHWLTDEHGIVGRCSRTGTQTGMTCACNPDSDRTGLPEKGFYIVITDEYGDRVGVYRKMQDAADRIALTPSRLSYLLKDKSELRYGRYKLYKHSRL